MAGICITEKETHVAKLETISARRISCPSYKLVTLWVWSASEKVHSSSGHTSNHQLFAVQFYYFRLLYLISRCLDYISRVRTLRKLVTISSLSIKNPAYGRHQLSRPRRIIRPIQFWRGCVIYLKKKRKKKEEEKRRGCVIFLIFFFFEREVAWFFSKNKKK